MGWSTWDYNSYLIRKGFDASTPGLPALQGFLKSVGSDKWPHDPELFPFIKDIRVLACEKDLVVQIENIGRLAGHWWYSNFVPQPSEVVRKFVTGKTKKGYFGLPLEFAPLDIIWTSGKATKIVASIAGPLAEGLYYIWLEQLALSALQTTQMIGLLFTACPDTADETLLADGLAVTFVGSGIGSLPLWQTIQDPLGRYNAPGATLTAKGNWCNMHMMGYVHAASEHIASLDIDLTNQGISFAHVELGELLPGTITPFHIFGSCGTTNPATISNRFTKNVISSGASGATYVGTRLTFNSNFLNPEYQSRNPYYNPCSARFPNAPALLQTPEG